MKFIIKYLFLLVFFNSLICNLFANEIKIIEVSGNNRVSSSSVIMFSTVKIGQNLNENDLNNVLKNLYNTNFFEDVSVELLKGEILKISVKEFPIIQNISFNGVKSDNLLSKIIDGSSLKARSSFNKIVLNNDKIKMTENLKNLGYFFSNIEVYVENL